MIKLGAKELRSSSPLQKDLKKIKKNSIYIIVDNVLDSYNVGGIFRLADAVAAEKVILCGETETPPNSRIKKASINTTEWVAWSYSSTAVQAIRELKSQNSKVKIIAIEQNSKSIPYNKVDYKFPVAFVVGHETIGVSKEVLDIADHIAEIPMWGVNKSLNVIVSLGIVLFEAIKYGKNR
ncbi:MAG: TrmH family RNA methyltransferase [Candidatus Levybacteria bacterium]|nr:TrmH family RNA methyltransferase [Candidatus Levybacteria bacterium]